MPGFSTGGRTKENARGIQEGTDKFSYEGKLEVVLTYEFDDATVTKLQGVFQGIYPRFDRMLGRSHRLPLLAAFESRP